MTPALLLLGRVALGAALFAAGVDDGSPFPTPAAERCTSAPAAAAAGDSGRAAIGRAWRAAGLDRLGDRVAHVTSVDVTQQSFQSDRPYPPFFSMTTRREAWLDPRTGVERATSRMEGLGAWGAPLMTTLTDGRATWGVRDTLVRPMPPLHFATVVTRPLDAWATLADWRGAAAASDVRVAGRCVYREYPRLVLERKGAFGAERLYLDEKTWLPVKLDREEPHYLWGQQRVEYQYQTWIMTDGAHGALHPGAVFRVVDGAVEIERVENAFAVAPADSAPSFRLPAGAGETAAMTPDLPLFLQPLPVDTVRAGERTVVLKNRGYREIAVMLRDTVYLLDATQGEARARLDSAWIAKLWPTHRAVVVIVTDLAWPHLAGVRYWVSRGATVVSHASSRPFLERVVARRWTREPDALERLRRASPEGEKRARLRFVGVRDSLSLAGGDLRLYPIDGVASEGALMAWVPRDGVLWASDFVQQLREPALYTTEVARAVARVGIEPRVVVAQHLDVTPWGAVKEVAVRRE